MASANLNNLLAVRLLRVRGHFNTCKKCKGAIGALDFDMLCQPVKSDLVEVAKKWEGNIAGRLASRRKSGSLQFLCPDPNAHGAAYSATAEAVQVVSVQDSLF